ncbi:ferric-dicitrate binding protein FerR (iron transport regulator) [Spirosoma lacussanchae]|uniref:FecR domain-containing protein n=1 Tax=Spirosoma lacussanchae TaxID=1884249 RepID=UPI00110819BE|nr:FecR domain-containing protein [Spirosoma lacussanchae]
MTPQDFIDNESFRRWVFANPPDEAAYWPLYLAQHPEQQESADLARTFLLTARGELPPVTDQQISDAVGQLLSAAPSQRPTVIRSLTGWSGWQPLRVAASVALLLTAGGLGWWYWQQQTQPITSQTAQVTPRADALIEISNTQAAPRLVKLADGSLVVLQQHARVRYPTRFNGSRRDVYLTGKAFFEVVRNPQQPFRVFARELTTEVLGTSFLISAPETGGTVNVVVKTGKVTVSTNPDFASRSTRHRPQPAAVVLLPNQQATFSTDDARLVKSDVNRAMATTLPATTQAFSFRRTPLPIVLDALAKAYGIAIQYDRESLSGCTLTARLDDPSLLARLDIIAASTGSTYALQDGQLVVQSAGCR